METKQIESGLTEMRTHLELLDGTIEAKKKRKADLKKFVSEDNQLNKELGKLKKDRNAVHSKVSWLAEFFKSINDGILPDALNGPLFAQTSPTPKTEKAHTEAVKSCTFLGWQETAGEPIPLFNVEFQTYQSTLSEKTLRANDIAMPDYPAYAKKSKKVAAPVLSGVEA